ncbi:MAG: CoxG family protein [Halarchaeum sp.]
MHAPVAVTVEREFDARPRAVWTALTDPVTVADALPASATLADDTARPRGSLARLLAADAETTRARTVDADEAFDATATARVRGVETSLDVSLTVETCTYPELALAGEARGDDASVEFAARATVAETGTGARVTAAAHADVTGALAMHGRRSVETAAARGANGFLDRLAGLLAATAGPESERAVKDPDWR